MAQRKFGWEKDTENHRSRQGECLLRTANTGIGGAQVVSGESVLKVQMLNIEAPPELGSEIS